MQVHFPLPLYPIRQPVDGEVEFTAQAMPQPGPDFSGYRIVRLVNAGAKSGKDLQIVSFTWDGEDVLPYLPVPLWMLLDIGVGGRLLTHKGSRISLRVSGKSGPLSLVALLVAATGCGGGFSSSSADVVDADHVDAGDDVPELRDARLVDGDPMDASLAHDVAGVDVIGVEASRDATPVVDAPVDQAVCDPPNVGPCGSGFVTPGTGVCFCTPNGCEPVDMTTACKCWGCACFLAQDLCPGTWPHATCVDTSDGPVLTCNGGDE
jgi:hypothetical protein